MSEIKTLSEVIAQQNALIGTQVTVTAFLLAYYHQTYFPEKRPGEDIMEYTRRVNDEVEFEFHCYLVENDSKNMIVHVDVNKGRYFWRGGERNTGCLGFGHLHNAILDLLYPFTRSAIYVKQSGLGQLFKDNGIEPFIVGTSFDYKMPVVITGTLLRSDMPGFRVDLTNLKSITVLPYKHWSRDYPEVKIDINE